jgi:HSP20 family molecular chaperone IbpA
MNLQQMISHGISMMDERQPNNITGVLTEFLQSQGINMNEIWTPAIDITETISTITVYVNIPGAKPDSIDVDFFNNRVDIKGERHRPFTNDTTVRKNEIIYGRFERKITLPISVTSRDSVAINAEDGVLVITIDKAREERNRFSVRVGESNGVQTSGAADVTLSTSFIEDDD